MRLETDRLVFRSFTADDLSAAHPPVGDPGQTPHQPFDLRDADAVRAQIRHALATQKEEPRVLFDLAVTRKSDGRLVGRGGYKKNVDELREAFVYLLLDPGTWNQGLTREAAHGLLTHAFEKLELHRVTSECDPHNPGALELMKTLGLRREGTFLENTWSGGAWMDTAMFAMLDREWTKSS